MTRTIQFKPSREVRRVGDQSSRSTTLKDSIVKRFCGKIAVVLSAGLISASALAGPDWNEGDEDAGATVGSSRAVSMGAGSIPLASVRGATVMGLVEGDFCDMIEINIYDPLNFEFLPTADINFDAQLFLFRGSDWGPNEFAGEPLLCFDNSSSTDNRPKFDNKIWSVITQTYWHPMTTQLSSIGESFAAGHYLIAITSSGYLPWGHGDTLNRQLFDPPVYGLGVRTIGLTLTYWLGTATTGTWNFSTQGVQFMPASACENAEVVTEFGERSIDTTLAGGSELSPQLCGPMGRDVWFRLAVNCPGEVRISTCGATFDTKIEVYRGTCDELGFVTCGDNVDFWMCNQGVGNLTSRVEFTHMQCEGATGSDYFVRVGSAGTTPGGIATVKFECIAPPESPDLNGDGVVNADDLAIMLSAWTTP